MQALIFAAGLGERMRPLTNTCPKPLLHAGNKPLIEWHIERLARAGCSKIVINTSWLAECFEPALGDGARWGLQLLYSYEGPNPLETGGGMALALNYLDGSPFIAVNGDIYCDYVLSQLPLQPEGLAHLILVPNPVHNRNGDFALDTQGHVHSNGRTQYTFSGIGCYRPELLTQYQHVWQQEGVLHPRFKLAPILRLAMADAQVTGTLHTGTWADIGTPQRLAELDNLLSQT